MKMLKLLWIVATHALEDAYYWTITVWGKKQQSFDYLSNNHLLWTHPVLVGDETK